MSDDNAEIREKIFSVCEEDAERGAEMIITFATDKGFKLDATADELVDHLENLDDDEDIELTPEMLADVAGGRRSGRFDTLWEAMRPRCSPMWGQRQVSWARSQTSTGDIPHARHALNWP